QPEAVVELVAALSDAALVAMGAAIREEVARRAERSSGARPPRLPAITSVTARMDPGAILANLQCD
ncbi:MAG: hypothetical protein ACK5BN_13375, partial [Planctomycetota bacterium]